jgi:hypothetical protein
METKDFENSVQFTRVNSGGQTYWLPLVNVDLIQPTGNAVSLSLLFDTGASVTTLSATLYPFLGLSSWDEGVKVEVVGIGGKVSNYRYNVTLEVFGKRIDCPIDLAQTLAPNPLFVGLLGRDTIFKEFGFGFWESIHNLYVTENP